MKKAQVAVISLLCAMIAVPWSYIVMDQLQHQRTSKVEMHVVVDDQVAVRAEDLPLVIDPIVPAAVQKQPPKVRGKHAKRRHPPMYAVECGYADAKIRYFEYTRNPSKETCMDSEVIQVLPM